MAKGEMTVGPVLRRLRRMEPEVTQLRVEKEKLRITTKELLFVPSEIVRHGRRSLQRLLKSVNPVYIRLFITVLRNVCI